ncbi:MAG: CHAP domain-containing protein [Kiloniellales bacterium]|nr:CHAP domain-containing protein [Kiloniellales bacterium]
MGLAVSRTTRPISSWPLLAAAALFLLPACSSSIEESSTPAPSAATHRTLAGLGLRPHLIETRRPLQCVPYARRLAGIQIRGDAGTWWDQAKGRYARNRTPKVGAILVIKSQGRSRGHLAVVTKILNRREIVADHANWLNRGRIHKNTPIIDVSAAGDWSTVRVWYTPGKVYGARRYAAHGFIHAATTTAAR